MGGFEEVGVRGGGEAERGIGNGVDEGEAVGAQHESLEAGTGGPYAVPGIVAVGDVAHNRVGGAAQVAADLMIASGFGDALQEGEAAGWKAAVGPGCFTAGQGAPMGEGPTLGFARCLAQRAFDGARIIHPAANRGEIMLGDALAVSHAFSQDRGGFRVFG